MLARLGPNGEKIVDGEGHFEVFTIDKETLLQLPSGADGTFQPYPMKITFDYQEQSKQACVEGPLAYGEQGTHGVEVRGPDGTKF